MKTFILVLSLLFVITGCTANAPEQRQDDVANDTTQNVPAARVRGDLYYIKDIETRDGKTFLKIDTVQILTATEQTCTTPPTKEEGVPECNPNGFLVQNDTEETLTYEVAPEASIQTTNFGTDPSGSSAVPLSDFVQSFQQQKNHFEVAPFVILKENERVTTIQEIYIP